VGGAVPAVVTAIREPTTVLIARGLLEQGKPLAGVARALGQTVGELDLLLWKYLGVKNLDLLDQIARPVTIKRPDPMF
jgi:hypothetical protein